MFIQPYLPEPPPKNSQITKQEFQTDVASRHQSRFGLRIFLKGQLHVLVFTIIHTIFSIYIRLRVFLHAVLDRILAILYYHHRTPELIRKDVKGLKRLPEHLSVILKLEQEGRSGASLEVLVDEVAEISAWCACVGIATLSIYEETGNEKCATSKIILTGYRYFERIHSCDASSNLTKAILVLRYPDSGSVTPSTSCSLHGVCTNHAGQ